MHSMPEKMYRKNEAEHAFEKEKYKPTETERMKRIPNPVNPSVWTVGEIRSLMIPIEKTHNKTPDKHVSISARLT